LIFRSAGISGAPASAQTLQTRKAFPFPEFRISNREGIAVFDFVASQFSPVRRLILRAGSRRRASSFWISYCRNATTANQAMREHLRDQPLALIGFRTAVRWAIES
jgi:hypothetical protein